MPVGSSTGTRPVESVLPVTVYSSALLRETVNVTNRFVTARPSGSSTTAVTPSGEVGETTPFSRVSPAVSNSSVAESVTRFWALKM